MRLAAIIAGIAAAAAAACAPLFQQNEEVPGPGDTPSIEAGFDSADAGKGDALVLPASAPGGDACNAQAHMHLIGLTYEQSRESTNLPRRVRFICHGCMVTQDFVADRLNLHLDPDGRVERLTCG